MTLHSVENKAPLVRSNRFYVRATILRNEINKKQFMPKGLSFVGLMDLGTLDALKKSSATKITQPSASPPEKNVELTVKESKEEAFKAATPSSEQVITYSQPC